MSLGIARCKPREPVFRSRRPLARLLNEGVFASLFSVCTKLTAAFCSFLTVYLIANRFGAAGSGVFGVGQTITSICIVFGAFALELGSLRSVAVLNAKNDLQGLRSWIRSALIITIIGTCSTAALAAAASESLAGLFASGPGDAATIIYFCAAAPLIALSRLFAAFLRGLRLTAVASVCDPLIAPTSFVTLYIIIYPAILPSIAFVYFASAAAAAIFGASLCISAFRSRNLLVGLGPIAISKSIGHSLPVYGSQINGFAASWIPILAVGAIASSFDAGLYRVAAQIVTLLAFVQQAIEVTVAPVLAEHHAKGTLFTIKSYARRQFFLVVVLALVPGVFIFIFAQDILKIFGPDFATSSTALRIMIAGQLGAMVFGPVGSVMWTTGMERSLLINSAIALGILLIGGAILIPIFGALGAAIAFGITTFLRAALGGIAVWQQRGLYLPLGIVRSRD